MNHREEDDMGKARRGLTYFPFDVDFYDDLRIRKLIRYKGGRAPQVYALMLCTIYRDGYYAKWDEEIPFIVAEKLSTEYDEAYIADVIKYCVELGLFDKEMFEIGILTSASIQRRWLNIQSSLRHKNGIEEYNLIENVADNDENVAELIQTAAFYEESSTKCQRKEKKGKEIERKETISNDIVVTLPNGKTNTKVPLETRKRLFYESLVPYLKSNGGEYDADMLRKFYDYWSEVSDGGSKMKWEKVRDKKDGTFELKLRLSKWRRNELEWTKERQSASIGKGSSISDALGALCGDDSLSSLGAIDEQEMLMI